MRVRVRGLGYEGASRGEPCVMEVERSLFNLDLVCIVFLLCVC